MKPTTKWIFLILAIAIPFVPLLASSQLLIQLSSKEGIDWAYSLFRTDHILNFGGNPSEVLSHLLNWIVMTGSMASLCLATAFESFIKGSLPCASENRKLLRLVPVLTFVVLAAWGSEIDGKHGEGTVAVAAVIFFAPTLLLLAFAMAMLLRHETRMKIELFPLPLLFFASFGLQWLYEPSGTGGPNFLVFPSLFALLFCFWLYCFVVSPKRHERINATT
jgi:hypothetical protein